jgi:membrane-bound lytic murein transglycosylase D
MRLGCILAMVLAGTFVALGQQETYTLDELLQAGQEWLEENLDEDTLRALDEVDQQKVQQLFRELQQRFQGEYVVDLAPLRQTAKVILPLLEAHAETQPYAEWLKTRLDYLEVAEQFRLIIPPPKVEEGQPPKPIPNPEPELQRKVWQQQLEKRPAPKEAHPYISRLKPIFAAQRLPPELAWVAEVESSFTPTARSPAGATGLYQLMPRTAKRFGLLLRPKDERLDPDKNARAAAQYLKYLHDRFKDWRLALAAYNAGEGRVQKLLDSHKTGDFDHIATHLPAETQMYVPKIEATLFRREGVTLAKLTPPAG